MLCLLYCVWLGSLACLIFDASTVQRYRNNGFPMYLKAMTKILTLTDSRRTQSLFSGSWLQGSPKGGQFGAGIAQNRSTNK